MSPDRKIIIFAFLATLDPLFHYSLDATTREKVLGVSASIPIYLILSNANIFPCPLAGGYTESRTQTSTQSCATYSPRSHLLPNPPLTPRYPRSITHPTPAPTTHAGKSHHEKLVPSSLAPRNVERIACSHCGCQSWRNSNTQVASSTPTAMRVARSRQGTIRNAASMKKTTYATLAGPKSFTHQRPGPG